MKSIRELRHTIAFLLINCLMISAGEVLHSHPKWWWGGFLVGAVNAALCMKLVSSIKKSVRIDQVVDKLDRR